MLPLQENDSVWLWDQQITCMFMDFGKSLNLLNPDCFSTICSIMSSTQGCFEIHADSIKVIMLSYSSLHLPIKSLFSSFTFFFCFILIPSSIFNWNTIHSSHRAQMSSLHRPFPNPTIRLGFSIFVMGLITFYHVHGGSSLINAQMISAAIFNNSSSKKNMSNS